MAEDARYPCSNQHCNRPEAHSGPCGPLTEEDIRQWTGDHEPSRDWMGRQNHPDNPNENPDPYLFGLPISTTQGGPVASPETADDLWNRVDDGSLEVAIGDDPDVIEMRMSQAVHDAILEAIAAAPRHGGPPMTVESGLRQAFHAGVRAFEYDELMPDSAIDQACDNYLATRKEK